ncbi:flavodoxin family protein [Candidatus Margulisiibacteriota bacterium]
MNNKKTLVIYYSLEGNTRLAAECIAETLGADILELKPVKEIQKTGFMRYFWGGKQVVMKESPALNPFDKDPGSYDTLIIGSPVWAFTYAPPIRSFIAAANPQSKKVAVFCTHEGIPGKTLEHMKKDLSGNEFVGEAGFDILKKEGIRGDAKAWAENLTGRI